VDASRVVTHPSLPTSFTDVMSVFDNSVDRAFFFARGASAAFSFEHIDFDDIPADMFHIGYALLLDAFDAPDDEYGTVMAKALAKAREKGLLLLRSGKNIIRIAPPLVITAKEIQCGAALLNATLGEVFKA
jgi:adenosylmethionine-8-amino-7-oxononanoate aminotransferase